MNGKEWIGFMLLRVETSGGLLWKKIINFRVTLNGVNLLALWESIRFHTSTEFDGVVYPSSWLNAAKQRHGKYLPNSQIHSLNWQKKNVGGQAFSHENGLHVWHFQIFARKLELQWADTIMANIKVIGVVKETGFLYFRTASNYWDLTFKWK